jgi:chromosome segregation ATPase
MKKNVLLAFVAAGAISLSSCTNKVDEKTVTEINQFGTEWAATGEKATAWSNELTTSTQQAHEFTAKTKTLSESMSTSKDEAMKTKAAEMNKMAEQDAATMDAMTAEWNSFKTTWDENTTAFTEWSAKATKGEVSPEDANKGLADWRTKLTDAQTKIDTWTTQLATARENTTRNMAMATELEQTATTPKTK